MTLLQQKLDLLFRMMVGQPGLPPVPNDVVIAELSRDHFDVRGRPVFAATDLHTVEHYEERFSELMAQGFAWLNLNFYGFLDGKGLVMVEFPNNPPRRCPATSVNFSGPTRAVSDSSWDARPHVELR